MAVQLRERKILYWIFRKKYNNLAMSQKESNPSLKLDKGRRQNMYWSNATICAAIKSNGSVC